MDILWGFIAIFLGPLMVAIPICWYWEEKRKREAAPPPPVREDPAGGVGIVATLILAPVAIAWVLVIVVLPFVILWWLL